MKVKIRLFIIGIAFLSGSSVLNAQSLGGVEGGNTVDCFSQSRDVEDFDYYDCGTCEKVDGRMGYGNTLTCSR